MKQKKNNCSEIRKSVSVEIVLQSFGLRAAKSFPNGKLYHAFFREDKNPSLVTYYNSPYAYDYGRNGKKYDVISLTELFMNCNTSEALLYLSSLPLFELKNNDNYENKCEIIKVSPVFLYPLKNYLYSRGITQNYWKYICEVHYKIPNCNSVFYSIGFKSNKENCYELRSSVFKGCSGKDITTIKNGSSKIIVFEGFFSFLSFLVLFPKINADMIIMNSTIMINRSIFFLEQNPYNEIILMLDNDESGSATTDILLSKFEKAIDNRHIFSGFNDINDYLVNKINLEK